MYRGNFIIYKRITIGYYYRRVKQLEMMVILHIGMIILIRKITPSICWSPSPSSSTAGGLLYLDENSCRQSLFLPHLVRCVGEDPSACFHRGRKIGPNGQASVGVPGLSGALARLLCCSSKAARMLSRSRM